jgi:hypothetical protein
MTPLKIAVQALGGVVCVALLIWAGRLAFSAENQDALAKLRDAAPGLVGLLFAISIAAIVADGLIFWLTLRPLRREKGLRTPPVLEIVAVNAIATFLNPLPFKLGMLARASLHMRLHAVSLREMISWLAGFAGVTLLAMGALIVAGQVRPEMDARMLAITLAIVMIGGGVMMLLGRLAQGNLTLQRLSLGAWPIAADRWAVFGTCVLRLSHVGLAGARFLVLAQILGLALTLGQGVRLGTSYIVVQATAPTGTLGVAEAITSKIGQALGLKIEEVALMVLLTTAAQTLTAGLISILALAWLRPWKTGPRVLPIEPTVVP